MSRLQAGGSSSGEAEERRSEQAEEAFPSKSDQIPEEVARELQDVAGFHPRDLFERRGPITTRGLAHLLENGDQVLEIQSDHVQIRRRDGSVQTFWNLERLPAWVKKVSKD